MIAFDTNVLVYAQQLKDSRNRHETAEFLVRRIALSGGMIPIQVLGEFLNVCKYKLKIAPLDAIGQVQDYLEIFECPQTMSGDLTDAALLAEQMNFSYFDALIITVARRAGATMLLSEDMQDGLEIDGLRIVNPFTVTNTAFLADYFDQGMP